MIRSAWNKVACRCYSRVNRPLAMTDNKWIAELEFPDQEGATSRSTTRLHMVGIQTGNTIHVHLPHPVSSLLCSHQRYLIMELAHPFLHDYSNNVVIGDPLTNKWYSFPTLFDDYVPSDYWSAAVRGNVNGLTPVMLLQITCGESLLFDFQSHGWHVGDEIHDPYLLSAQLRRIQWCGDAFYTCVSDSENRKSNPLLKYDMSRLEWDSSKEISYSVGSDLELLHSFRQWPWRRVSLSGHLFYRLCKEAGFRFPSYPPFLSSAAPELARAWIKEDETSDRPEFPSFMQLMHWTLFFNEEPVDLIRKNGTYIWCTKDQVIVYDEDDKEFRDIPACLQNENSCANRLYLEYGSHDDKLLRCFEDFSRLEPML